MSSTLPVEYLIAGACYDDNNTFLSCALQPLDCKTGESFVSPLWLASNANPSVDCSSQESIRSILAMGRCNNDSDEYLCTSDRSACRRKSSFHRTNDCTLHQDSFAMNDFHKPMFGRCHHNRNPGRDWCAWKSSECIGDDFNFGLAHPDAVHAAFESCECNDLHIGACVNTNGEVDTHYCAITEDACNTEPDYTYMSALDFQSEKKSSCRLCDSTIITTTNPPTVPPTKIATVPTTSTILTIPKNSMNNNSGSKKLSTGAVVGICAGIVAVAIIAIGRVILITRRRSSLNDTNNTKQSSTTVVTTSDETATIANEKVQEEKARDFV